MDWTKPNDIIQENHRRLEIINTPYDPYCGTPYCDEIPRVQLDIPDAPFPHMWIPKDMESEYVVRALRKAGTLSNAGKGLFGGAASDNKSIEVWIEFCKLRCKYDFEFWCATQIVIEHKILLTDVPFVLNRAQRFYLQTLEKLRREGKPIFVILLKARQWGGSTLTQFYMMWIQLMWKKNWNSVVCADVDDQALNVLGMFKKAIENYDTMITRGKHIKFVPYMGMDSTRVIEHRGCRVSVGSVQHPEKIRSQNVTMAHLTEVGVWSDTLHHSPKALAQNLAGTIQPKPYRLKVLESTAKGVGNFFHRTWLGAMKKKNEYTPVFVPWYMIDFYSKPIEDYSAFIVSMTAYERVLFSYGATLEAICYYRDLQEQFHDNPNGIFNEFPSTWQEAFQSTGSNFYPAEYVEELRKGVCDPIFVGDIVGNDRKGKAALENVHKVSDSNGKLKIWLDKDNKPPMMYRYIVIVDIGGRSKNADFTDILVEDRYWMHEPGGVPEVAAEWHGHIDHDILAWKAAQVATYYDNALLVIESNTAEKEGQRTEGNHVATIISEIAEIYDNVYQRNKKEQMVKGGIARYGFHTNPSTKPMVCDFELACLRDGLYIEHDNDAVDEHATFEVKEDGSLGAVEGCHDDKHITRAVGNYFCYHENYMPRVRFINKPKKPQDQEVNPMILEKSNKQMNEYTY